VSNLNTEVYYYRARYYDFSNGRFLSEDPARSSWNFFSYVGNTPFIYIDPMGLVQIAYEVHRHRKGFWNGGYGWKAGTVTPHYNAQGECKETCNHKWKLHVKLTLSFDFEYSSVSNEDHEQRHLEIAETFWQRNKAPFEAFEGTYDSKIECEHYSRVRVGTARSGLTREFLRVLQTLHGRLEEQQSAFDGFWGFVYH
jgi:hypothetical protein